VDGLTNQFEEAAEDAQEFAAKTKEAMR